MIVSASRNVIISGTVTLQNTIPQEEVHQALGVLLRSEYHRVTGLVLESNGSTQLHNEAWMHIRNLNLASDKSLQTLAVRNIHSCYDSGGRLERAVSLLLFHETFLQNLRYFALVSSPTHRTLAPSHIFHLFLRAISLEEIERIEWLAERASIKTVELEDVDMKSNFPVHRNINNEHIYWLWTILLAGAHHVHLRFKQVTLLLLVRQKHAHTQKKE